jgi:hypothetical protein
MAVDQKSVDAQIKALGEFHEYFTRKEIGYLPQVLNGGENIRALTSGFHQGTTWLITVTDHRILFLDKGMLFGLKQFELPLRQISSITHNTGLMYGVITIATSGGRSEITQIPKREVVKIAGIISSLVRDATTPIRITNDSSNPADLASQLERLASLVEKGILTPEEFATQKAKLLS